MDGLNGESLKNADPLLLSLCFTCIFKHSYMPADMLNSVIIPLVKNKCGTLSYKNNYRPIALSSIASKEYMCINDNQFGFKSGTGTELCVYALSEFI